MKDAFCYCLKSHTIIFNLFPTHYFRPSIYSSSNFPGEPARDEGTVNFSLLFLSIILRLNYYIQCFKNHNVQIFCFVLLDLWKNKRSKENLNLKLFCY